MGCSESKHNHPYGCDTEKQDVPVRDKDKKKVIVSTFQLIFFLAPIETLTQQLRFRKLSPYINYNKFMRRGSNRNTVGFGETEIYGFKTFRI